MPPRSPRTLADPDPLQARLMASGRGDVQAFAELYDRVTPRVHGLAVRILRDAHQSEEVTQEVLLQVWQTAAHFDPSRGSALAWIMTLAHRRAVDRVRSSEAARRRDAAHVGLTHAAPFDETAESAHASLEAQEVRAALAALSPPQREAIELAYFGGYTYGEVSRLMQIPLGTAKSRIRDGLIRLAGLLSPVVVEPA
ncbi:MAG: ECF RNA polymerase sigma factor SigK [Nocardioides sp.]|nr:ECF RNA polymerase sigma factor SigK [Nocardioides sp.]